MTSDAVAAVKAGKEFHTPYISVG